MGLFGDADEVLTHSFDDLKAVATSYHFAAGSTITVRAWEGMLASSGTAGVSDAENQYVDWIFDKEELVVATVQQEPSRGDTLTYDGVTHEILPLTEGGAAWEYSGINRQWFRVHTKMQS